MPKNGSKGNLYLESVPKLKDETPTPNAKSNVKNKQKRSQGSFRKKEKILNTRARNKTTIVKIRNKKLSALDNNMSIFLTSHK